KIFDEDLDKSIKRNDTEEEAKKRFERTAKKEEAKNAQNLLKETLKKLDDKNRKIDKDDDNKTLYESMDNKQRLEFQNKMKNQMEEKEKEYVANLVGSSEEKKERLKIKLFEDLDNISGAILKTKQELQSNINSDEILKIFEAITSNPSSSGGSAGDSNNLPPAQPLNQDSTENNSDKKTNEEISQEIMNNFIKATLIKRNTWNY
ncbi:MAG: hypothetical protein ACKO6C_02475, partial [Alphaproteobacteria bacterium]